MEKRLLTFFLFACLTCSAQLPVVPMVLKSAAAAQDIPQTIAGLTEWWYYVDSLATNDVVTNWYGRVQNTLLTNGASSLRPTNSASGVGFTQTQQLTNNNITLGTNWTSVVYFKQTRQGDFSQYCIWGEGGDDFILGPINQGGSNSRMMYEDHTGVQVSPVSQFVGLNTYVFFALVMSNQIAGGGLSYFYTNGIFSATAVPENTITKMGTVGYQPSGANNVNNSAFNGFIKQIILYTNNLSALNISNLYYWCTNSP